MKKKIGKCMLCIAILVSITGMTTLAAGSYSSTYDMTGGVFSRSIKANNSITTSVTPSEGTLGCDMGVILATKHWYGWDGPVKYVSSVKGGTVTHKCNGTYKIWLRNYSGIRWFGNVDFSWK